MNIFLDTVSPKNALIIFNDEREIIDFYEFDVRLNESTLLIEEFDRFLQRNHLSYRDITHMVVVNGPGSFTWVRTTVLMANTINFVTQKHMTPLSYFQLFDTYPIVKTSSKRDVFVQWSASSPVEVVSNEYFEEMLWKNAFEKWSWDYNMSTQENHAYVDYQKIIRNLSLQAHTQIEAQYFKKPNIM